MVWGKLTRTRHFGEINQIFWIDATFSVPKNKIVQKRCFWEEHTHFLLSKTSKLFDNGQLLMILEGFFDMSLWFLHLHACYCLICPMYQAITTNDKQWWQILRVHMWKSLVRLKNPSKITNNCPLSKSLGVLESRKCVCSSQKHLFCTILVFWTEKVTSFKKLWFISRKHLVDISKNSKQLVQ